MKKEGFTYIELLMTLVIMATLIIPIMELFSYSLYSSTTSQDLITATNLAGWQMERLKNLSFTKEQLRKLPVVFYPPEDEEPIKLNNMSWRIKSTIVKEGNPVEVLISAYRDGEDEPVVTLVTLMEDMYWEEAGAN